LINPSEESLLRKSYSSVRRSLSVFGVNTLGKDCFCEIQRKETPLFRVFYYVTLQVVRGWSIEITALESYRNGIVPRDIFKTFVENPLKTVVFLCTFLRVFLSDLGKVLAFRFLRNSFAFIQQNRQHACLRQYERYNIKSITNDFIILR